ncbi:extensin-like [Prunus avium]|uniref:Extensin-like n=1 Tax=Prunus avium TaxID=42229 RepID=A0A6P5TZF3_PRUAV|nr:extensin-like [Prunus avium]
MAGPAAPLQNPYPYTGPHNDYMANGDSMNITHTGTLPLTLGSSHFRFPHVYRLPSLQKKLLSVAQFSKDHHGPCEDGLYPVPPASVSSSTPPVALAVLHSTTWQHLSSPVQPSPSWVPVDIQPVSTPLQPMLPSPRSLPYSPSSAPTTLSNPIPPMPSSTLHGVSSAFAEPPSPLTSSPPSLDTFDPPSPPVAPPSPSLHLLPPPPPTQSLPPSQLVPPAIPRHSMTTRLRDGNTKPKHHSDGTVQYPLPKALLHQISNLEPTCFT